MKLTFRSKLFLYFVSLILVTSIPIAIIIYNYIYTSQKNDLNLNAQAQMIQVDNTFSSMIKQIKENNRFLATSADITKADSSILALFNMSNNDSLKKFSKQIPGLESIIYSDFETYGTTHPDASYVYLGTKWGGYIQWPDGLTINKYDPRERNWYIQALKNPDEVVISDPYASYDETHSLIISASSTVKDSSGNIIGVMGLDVSLDELSKIVSNIKIGNTGYTFLFSKDGTILAHPNTNLNFKNISQLNQQVNAKTGEMINNSFTDYEKLLVAGNSSFESVINGAPVFINVYSSPNTGWKMATVIQKSELNDRASKSGFFIILVTMCILFFVILLIYIVTKNITKPITKLTSLMDVAGNGDLNVRANIQTNDEFGKLGSSFNLMIEKLSSNYQELTEVHEELLATEEELRAQYEELQFNEDALRNSDERYRLALEGSNDSIWQWDLVTGDFFASDKLYEIMGYNIKENSNLTRYFDKLIHPDDLAIARKNLQDHINNITPIYKSEYRIKALDGSYVWVSSRGKALRDSEGIAIKISGSITDISERKISEDKIKFMAFYDSLTKLPNRVSFMNKLNDQLELMKSENTEGAVFFIDLDNFKNINDTMGHDYGDKLLIDLAKQFERLIDEKDTLCRLGGDEFILLHPNCEPLEVATYTENIHNLFDNIFVIDNKQIYITASIGVAIYPKDGTDPNSILRSADAAMYKAKELGKNRASLYDEEMYLQLERKTCIERILRTSIKNKELSIYYQPQYDAQKNEIFGFEALLRLNSKELGFISPVEFIPIAEESGFITKLDRWVLNEACIQSVKWLDAGYSFKSISVNISSVDIQQPDFVESIKSILENTGIDTNIVELEITETVLMQSLDSNIKILNKLKDMGFRIALDDFGTGYSSLNYLRRIPISTLKIDKSFIDNITSNVKEKSIINNIIQMAHSLGLIVIAEGVETEEQLSILKERNCDYIQGYYFSRPLPASEIEKLLD
jgi:diguanylate cyclase (GGDEF)-like protein/PAS domain S-box-containing protein